MTASSASRALLRFGNGLFSSMESLLSFSPIRVVALGPTDAAANRFSDADNQGVVDSVGDLERGRAAHAEQAWAEACAALTAVDSTEPLGPDDLELLAEAAYMLGSEADYLEALERAHRAHIDAGDRLAALRCAFWIGVNLARRGEMGRANGWLTRAARLLEEEGGEPVERGYLLLPGVFEREATGELEAAAERAADAAAIGRRFGDQDLFALAAHEQGHVLIKLGRIREGVALLDETMVAVTAGELSPIVSGIVYCGVILACQDAHEIARAQEWTAALSTWCERQPDLVAFTGRCLLHRAELMQLQGAWSEALEEARRAGDRCAEAENPGAAGEAHYRQGEIHRMRGDFEAAAASFREASRQAREPQPGMALLRLAQGDSDAASASIARALAEASEVGRRVALLPAQVEISLSTGDLETAQAAAGELESIAAVQEEGALAAMAAAARGAVELGRGEAGVALTFLRRAEELWRGLEAPYEVACARESIAVACRMLGDEDTAALELEAARSAYEELGAAPDLERFGASAAGGRDDRHGLTDRELEVLRHLAAGETNRAIAAELVLSERTVDRHVSNVFAKLNVSSRAAATAFAYEHRLL
jgi:DNA-binding CsgD family transcriptional regulator